MKLFMFIGFFFSAEKTPRKTTPPPKKKQGFSILTEPLKSLEWKGKRSKKQGISRKGKTKEFKKKTWKGRTGYRGFAEGGFLKDGFGGCSLDPNQEDVNGEKLTVKKWWILGADFFTVWCRFFHGLRRFFTVYKGHKR